MIEKSTSFCYRWFAARVYQTKNKKYQNKWESTVGKWNNAQNINYKEAAGDNTRGKRNAIERKICVRIMEEGGERGWSSEDIETALEQKCVAHWFPYPYAFSFIIWRIRWRFFFFLFTHLYFSRLAYITGNAQF